MVTESAISRLNSLAQGVLHARRWLVASLFILGLLLRVPMLGGEHREGDEVIYMSLVGQLEQGHGYSLQKSPLVERGVVDRYQYDRPLFYHPPGGIALFWLSYKVFGSAGFPAVQLLSFALFFWSMLLFAHCLQITKTDVGLFLVALLSSFNPILAHVTTKYWLDGPLLAFATLGGALFLYSFVRTPTGAVAPTSGRSRSRRSTPSRRARPADATTGGGRGVLLAAVAGAVVGYASLIKLTAFLAVPGVLLLCLATVRPRKAKTFLLHTLCFLIPALVVQAPWEIWQWLVVGSPFPQWAGKPSQTLVQSNRYVHFLTVVRSPWVYLTTTPQVLTTLVPSVVLLALFYGRDRTLPAASVAPPADSVRAAATACLLWLVLVIGFHTALGLAGYSKLLRYVILATPASILLPALLVPCSRQALSTKGAFVRAVRWPVTACLAAGVVAEVATGIAAAFRFQSALIVPFTGL
jgi:4-amino-4-deoxy-L-arabinose transferase-like glycosyltransferase